jgi:ABC-type bacteriocin/lantibiotic exporter with double-glycine peptidase domain
MLSRVKIVHITFVVLALGTQGQGTAREPDKAGAVPGPQVVRGDKLTKEQFEALPDTAIIEFKGKRMTKAEIRARAAKSQEAMATAKAVALQAKAEFEQRRIQIEREQQAKIQADKAKAMAEFERHAATTKAIQKEAAELYERSKRASPTERAEIDKRAHQLLLQLRQSSQVSPPR